MTQSSQNTLGASDAFAAAADYISGVFGPMAATSFKNLVSTISDNAAGATRRADYIRAIPRLSTPMTTSDPISSAYLADYLAALALPSLTWSASTRGIISLLSCDGLIDAWGRTTGRVDTFWLRSVTATIQ